jgi:hypothetical protein
VDLGGDWVHATLEATLGPVADEAKRVDDPSPTTGCQRRLSLVLAHFPCLASACRAWGGCGLCEHVRRAILKPFRRCCPTWQACR